jgi:hypothetical protein
MIFFLVCWIGIDVISTILLPDPEHVDVMLGRRLLRSKKGNTSIHYNCYRILALDSFRLRRSSKPKIIILGASNSMIGFRPDEMAPLFPEYEVANLGYPGATILDINEIAQMTQALLPPDVLENSVFVVSIWYGTFRIASADGWGVNDILCGTGLYKLEAGKLRSITNIEYMPFLSRALRPYFFVQFALSMLPVPDERIPERPNLKHFLHNSHKFFEPIEKFSARWYGPFQTPPSEKERDWLVYEFFDQEPNGESELPQKGFEKLYDLCRLTQEAGARLVLVDVPVPEWHKQRSHLYQDYQRRKEIFLEKALRYSDVCYVNLLDVEELSGDRAFSDATHPALDMTKTWSEALSERWSDLWIEAKGSL